MRGKNGRAHQVQLRAKLLILHELCYEVTRSEHPISFREAKAPLQEFDHQRKTFEPFGKCHTF